MGGDSETVHSYEEGRNVARWVYGTHCFGILDLF